MCSHSILTVRGVLKPGYSLAGFGSWLLYWSYSLRSSTSVGWTFTWLTNFSTGTSIIPTLIFSVASLYHSNFSDGGDRTGGAVCVYETGAIPSSVIFAVRTRNS